MLPPRWSDTFDVGVAVLIDHGLVVPVVHRADEKDLSTLDGEITALAERASAGTLTIDDVRGAVFAVRIWAAIPSTPSRRWCINR